jgi:hypothetical protein
LRLCNFIKRLIWLTILVTRGSKQHGTCILVRILWLAHNMAEKQKGNWLCAEGAHVVVLLYNNQLSRKWAHLERTPFVSGTPMTQISSTRPHLLKVPPPQHHHPGDQASNTWTSEGQTYADHRSYWKILEYHIEPTTLNKILYVFLWNIFASNSHHS